MSDVDQELSKTQGGHFTVPHPIYSSNNPFLDNIRTIPPSLPPFAPQLDIGQHHNYTVINITHGATTPLVSPSDCNIHEFCYYFQQVIFISAIMTGSASFIAGAIMNAQRGELLVFLYIGVLLVSVNTVLLTIQCYVRRKQKKRARVYSAGYSPQDTIVVQYNILSTNPPLGVPVSHSQPTTLMSGD